ncbi:MIP/aquaporin family protein [Silvibacterium acidisoli]|uniref:MIP/aquaporin family protein n=1 Tax=Acidobacteriaceae bacterium ZG23-2 TaxID=2883246 RepID=UPI00406CB8E5
MIVPRSPELGEFAGTLVMILLGDGVVAGVLLKRSKAEDAGWLAITTAWAFAVLCGIFTANLFGSTDAHLNPAITLAMGVKGGGFGKVLPYALAQLAGGFAGAVLVWLHYLPHWKVSDDAGAKLGVFCTRPAIRSYAANLLSEIIATATLIVVIGAISSKLVLTTGAAAGLSPYLVSCVVWGIGLSLGGTTGYAMNPARDFGPRLAHAILPIAGKGGSDFRYAPIPVFGPAIGGVIAGLILRWIGA